MKVNCDLTCIGIPQDVVEAAEKVAMDAETLVTLCVSHTVDAARDFLTSLAGKLPSLSNR